MAVRETIDPTTYFADWHFPVREHFWRRFGLVRSPGVPHRWHVPALPRPTFGVGDIFYDAGETRALQVWESLGATLEVHHLQCADITWARTNAYLLTPAALVGAMQSGLLPPENRINAQESSTEIGRALLSAAPL